ncbi:hypothetical protein AK812_SmicGene33658 [Symbiodinium microadriaticum]|uniref:CSD domain-containing protein n=1 Tax=Symbiodinium microadriaticum TaxID=2951 RepID=A0A1Q9CR05_SYMMI|nr:hypothetical protein AK812_SmicGene33658 [Symbiodinium microadriaticum]
MALPGSAESKFGVDEIRWSEICWKPGLMHLREVSAMLDSTSRGSRRGAGEGDSSQLSRGHNSRLTFFSFVEQVFETDIFVLLSLSHKGTIAGRHGGLTFSHWMECWDLTLAQTAHTAIFSMSTGRMVGLPGEAYAGYAPAERPLWPSGRHAGFKRKEKVDANAELGHFMGRIKAFNAEKGFGFIVSEELASLGYLEDVFLLAKDAPQRPTCEAGPGPGQVVAFRTPGAASWILGSFLDPPSHKRLIPKDCFGSWAMHTHNTLRYDGEALGLETVQQWIEDKSLKKRCEQIELVSKKVKSEVTQLLSVFIFQCRHLHTLVLANNPIGDDGAESLACYMQIRKQDAACAVRFLDLSGTRLTADSVGHVASAFMGQWDANGEPCLAALQASCPW